MRGEQRAIAGMKPQYFNGPEICCWARYDDPKNPDQGIVRQGEHIANSAPTDGAVYNLPRRQRSDTHLLSWLIAKPGPYACCSCSYWNSSHSLLEGGQDHRWVVLLRLTAVKSMINVLGTSSPLGYFEHTPINSKNIILCLWIIMWLLGSEMMMAMVYNGAITRQSRRRACVII